MNRRIKQNIILIVGHSDIGSTIAKHVERLSDDLSVKIIKVEEAMNKANIVRSTSSKLYDSPKILSPVIKINNDRPYTIKNGGKKNKRNRRF